MPSRMLRDWTDSLRFDGISADAERLYVRLIMKADDYGRFHADPRLIKAACYPFFETLRPNDLSRWLDDLSNRQLILRYETKGRSLLAIVNYGQRLKQSRAKFPQKDGEDDEWTPVFADFRELPGTSGNFPPEEKRREVEEEKRSASGGKGASSKSGNSPEMIRIGKILNRRDSTKWSDDEIKTFKQIDFTEDEIELIERFYSFTERQNEPLHRRTTLITLLRHWAGEVDKGRLWSKRYGMTRQRPTSTQTEAIPERRLIPREELAEFFPIKKP